MPPLSDPPPKNHSHHLFWDPLPHHWSRNLENMSIVDVGDGDICRPLIEIPCFIWYEHTNTDTKIQYEYKNTKALTHWYRLVLRLHLTITYIREALKITKLALNLNKLNNKKLLLTLHSKDSVYCLPSLLQILDCQRKLDYSCQKFVCCL